MARHHPACRTCGEGWRLSRTDARNATTLNATTWSYDTQTMADTVAAPGQLTRTVHTISSGEQVGSHSVALAYDTLGRLMGREVSIDGNAALTFEEQYTYGEYGRPFQKFDASDDFAGVRYHYNSAGYLAKISESAKAVPVTNTNNPVAYYTVTAMNARGQVTGATLGNDVVLDRTYQADSGYLHTMKATNGSSQELQKLTLTFDELGNLTKRHDQGLSKLMGGPAKNMEEVFTYDNLNRLKTTRIAGEASANVDTTYDARGNIKTKSGVGTYAYGNTSNRLVSVTPSGGTAVTYAYDSNGNLTSGDGRTLSYTSFDKPHTITKGTGQTVKFAYDGERARYKRSVTTGTGTNAVTTTTYYVGNVEIRNVTGGKQYTRYVEGHAIVKLTRNDSSRTAISTDYLITDHLGSIDAIADSSGALLYDLSFDAWGRRRAADSTFAIINTPATALATLNNLTPRGFTGHEMLDTVGLIHMNGRVYDPRLGRFTSADPIVQFPHYSQSFNRYSYVFNNPLSYTDPSGYLVKELYNVVVDIVYIVWGDGWADPKAWVDLVLDLKALFDELGGSGSGGNTNNPWVIQNLDGMGPVTAFGNQATIGQGVMGPSDTINQRPGVPQNRVARAVIGVTYSDITGGKFANGAATAGFSRLFNDDPNRRRETARQEAEFDRFMIFVRNQGVERKVGDDFNSEIIAENWDDLPEAVRNYEPGGYGSIVDDRGYHIENQRLPGGYHLTVNKPGGVVSVHFDAHDPLKGPVENYKHWYNEVRRIDSGKLRELDADDFHTNWKN